MSWSGSGVHGISRATRRSRAWNGLLVTRLIAAAALTLAALGCGRPGETGAPTETDPAPSLGPAGVVEVPDPDLSGMEPQVAEHLSGARRSALASPDSAEAWGGFGASLQAHDLLDAAASCYERASALAGDDFRWPYLLAVVEAERGASPDRVLPLFDGALLLRPEFTPAHVRRARVLLTHGRLEEARASFERAATLDTSSAAAHRGMGQTLLALGEPDAALEYLKRAAELAPGDAATHSALSRAFTQLGLADEAAGAAERARRGKPLGLLADPVLEETVTAKGVSARHLFTRARGRLTAGDLRGALGDLERVVAIRPEDPDVLYLMGVAHEGLGEKDRAAELMSRALEMKPDHTRARLSLARVHLDRGRQDDALAELRKAREHAPQDPLVLVALSGALAAHDRVDELIGVYEDLRAISPDEPRIALNLGTAWFKKGDLARAEKFLREALALDPEYADAHFLLGLTLERLGRAEAARRHYEHAVRIDPDHPARQQLAP